MGDGRQTHVWGTNRASAGLTDNGNGLAADECQRGGWRLKCQTKDCILYELLKRTC